MIQSANKIDFFSKSLPLHYLSIISILFLNQSYMFLLRPSHPNVLIPLATVNTAYSDLNIVIVSVLVLNNFKVFDIFYLNESNILAVNNFSIIIVDFL